MTQIPVINMVATGQNITRLRMQAGLSVANLQQIFGFTTPQAIYKWQRGAALPTVDNLVVLSAVFNTNINNILVKIPTCIRCVKTKCLSQIALCI